MDIDGNLLSRFENQLNSAYPHLSGIPPKILGYGEISTTFSISDMPEIAFKRMPPFESPLQIENYKSAVDHYCNLLNKKCDISVSEYDFYEMTNRHGENILYVAQPKLPESSIGNNILKSGERKELERMICHLMERFIKLYHFNRENMENTKIGVDGQLSNWSFDIAEKETTSSVYFDITTPLFQINGKEQLDTEIFLKSCPSFLVWLVRWQFLQEVLDRYYDVRMILIDIVANFYKEGRQDLLEDAISIINAKIKDDSIDADFQLLTFAEVESYYKNDAFIWSLFLTLRRFDRFIKTRILRKRYNFILPGKISR